MILLENKENKSVYIMSLDASEIWEHMHRDREPKREFIGMLPDSLGLDKLYEFGLKTWNSKRYDKVCSNDIINIEFNRKVRSSEEIIEALHKKITDENKTKIEDIIKTVAEKEYEEIKVDDIENKDGEVIKKGLRTRLYEDGFTIREIDKETGVVKETQYVLLNRTSSKSRTSKVLFIRKKLRDKAIRWARLGMDLEDANDVDFPALLAYESLVYSSCESRIHIDVDNILIVSDVKSIFPCDVNIVQKNDDGLLESVPHDGYMMESDLFDGEGLLDSKYYKDGKSMALTRQHMFKCCMFNSNLEKFFRDYAKANGIDYDTWQIENMFGEPMFVKDIHCIITPNSLKALKFAHKKKSKKEMWKHWKEKVRKENMFGVVKQEKSSQRGYDDDGNILNQTSYQILNSMTPLSHADMVELSQFEVDYIKKLKNDDETYIQWLDANKNDRNSNQMWVDLYKINPKITHVRLLKNKRRKDISDYVKHCKRGKIRLNSDYCTIIQNGKELLYHAIGKLPAGKDGTLDYEAWEPEMILKDNEAYTTLHEFGKEYIACRNPHTAQSNVLILKNTKIKFIEDYFNINDNIIYTNAINFPINRILSGQDVDSDSLILFNPDSPKMLEAAGECYVKSDQSNYRVCVNGVGESPNKYIVNNTDMAKIDSTLAKSQKYIGTVVNLGQLYMSKYNHMIANGEKDESKLDEALKAIDICTVLSEISIDLAKRFYYLDIKKQIQHLAKSKLLDVTVPNFFVNVSQNDNISGRTKHHDTPVDYLFKILDGIPDAEDKDTIKFDTLLKDIDTRKVKKKQLLNILYLLDSGNAKIKGIETKYGDCENDNDKKKKKNNAIMEAIADIDRNIGKYKITDTVMCALIYYIIAPKVIDGSMASPCRYKTDALNALYRYNKDIFLSLFK